MIGCKEEPSSAQSSAVYEPIVAIPDTISLISYNCENLFDFIKNGNEYPEYQPNKNGYTRTLHDLKINNIASVLYAAHADIAVLQEIENPTAARELLDALDKRGLHYGFVAAGNKPEVTLTMPFVFSRFPIVKTDGYAVKGEKYPSRNILEAHIALDNDTIIVFANHWPSPAATEEYRIAAAHTLADRLKQLPPQTDYILAGDFNIGYDEARDAVFTKKKEDTNSLNLVLGTALLKPGKAPIYVTELFLAENSGWYHYDLWLELPPAHRMSLKFKGANGTPDHILLPRTLYDSLGLSYCDNSFSTFTMHDSLLMEGQPYRWQMRYSAHARFHIGDGYSDHLPIMAKFTRRPFTPEGTTERPPNPPKGGFKIKVPPTGEPERRGRCVNPSNKKEKPLTNKATKTTSSIAQPINGWEPCSKPFTVVLKSNNSFIHGDPGEKNLCAARIVLSSEKPARAVALTFSGKGRFLIRTKIGEESPWTIFCPPDFAPKKGGRYQELNFTSAQSLRLNIGSVPANTLVGCELRAGKGCPWVCEVVSAELVM